MRQGRYSDLSVLIVSLEDETLKLISSGDGSWIYHVKEEDTRRCHKTGWFEHEFLANECSSEKMIEDHIWRNLIQDVKRDAIIPC